MSVSRLWWIPWLGAILALPISTYVVFWMSFYVLAELDEGWRPTWMGNSSYADILVITPDNSTTGYSVELIPVSSAASYRESHRGATFLIPTDRQEELKKRLQDDLHLSWNTFDVKRISDRQQEVTLYFMDRTDDSHGSRYKADSDGVQLERYRYISDRGGIGIVLIAMLLTAAVHAIVLVYCVYRAVRRGRASVSADV